MIVPPSVLTAVESVVSAVFASAIAASLFDTARSLLKERLLKTVAPGDRGANLVAINVQELKTASAEIDVLKQKIDNLIKTNEELEVKLKSARIGDHAT